MTNYLEQWKLGIVEELLTGADGENRAAVL
jgi:hypothetical protein